MGYIEDLRAIIGHKRIILNGSVVIIRNAAGEILMQQRTYPHGRWGLPGGLMELGESAEETARREVYEETGLRIGALALLGVYSGAGYLCVSQNGDEFYVVSTAYWTDEFSGEAHVNDGESLAIQWVNIGRLPENIAKTHRQILDDYLWSGLSRAAGTHQVKLVRPAPEHEQKAMEYRQEYIDSGETTINGSGGLMRAVSQKGWLDYKSWLETVTSANITAPPGWVTSDTYFAFVGDKIVGTIQVRHGLTNDRLRDFSGHIGYGVRPSERRKGYAAQMLRLALERCRELGIDRVLITCLQGNEASAGTILKCGGVFENEILDENGKILQRYWINIG